MSSSTIQIKTRAKFHMKYSFIGRSIVVLNNLFNKLGIKHVNIGESFYFDSKSEIGCERSLIVDFKT